MDDLPVPVSAAASPASLAASTCKLVAVAKPILRTTQSTDVQASLRIKNDDSATNQPCRISRGSPISPECQYNDVASAGHAHHAAHRSEAKRAEHSRDSDRACVAANATTCCHASIVLSTGDVFRQLMAGCSFYFGRLSASGAGRKLSPCAVGTFLLRDSSDRRFLFALTVQTHRGPTSVRLAREESGRFRLDCDRSQRSAIPTFPSVIDLVRFYFRPVTDRRCVLVDGGDAANSIPVRLMAYLTASGNPPTLADCARLSVHSARRRNLERSSTHRSEPRQECVECFVDSLPPYVDEKTKTFLQRYPFDI